MFDDTSESYPSFIVIQDYAQPQSPTLLEVLMSLKPTLVGDTLYLDRLKIVTRDRLSLQSLEEVVISSGRNKNHNGDINAVHINPTLDEYGNPIRNRHIPFNQLRRVQSLSALLTRITNIVGAANGTGNSRRTQKTNSNL